MNAFVEQILANLQDVTTERVRRAADASLASRVLAVKAFQHARFMQTYADLLADSRYAGAARFFLDDLYGPHDFARRDDQFARVVPGLVRLFPQEIVSTVLALSQLHGLSERLDSAMAERVQAGQVIDGATYGAVWRAVGRREDRERQIELMLAVGRALDAYTRNLLLRHSLRLMRAPAHAAGLGDLQAFLERGFETFRQMRGAGVFLATIAGRERELAAKLFDGGAAPDVAFE